MARVGSGDFNFVSTWPRSNFASGGPSGVDILALANANAPGGGPAFIFPKSLSRDRPGVFGFCGTEFSGYKARKATHKFHIRWPWCSEKFESKSYDLPLPALLVGGGKPRWPGWNEPSQISSRASYGRLSHSRTGHALSRVSIHAFPEVCCASFEANVGLIAPIYAQCSTDR